MGLHEVKEVKREEYGLCDELVRRSPQGTIFHSSDWSSMCATSLRKGLRIFGCFRRGCLVAGCIFYVYKKGFFKIASSAFSPATPFGGIILEKPPTKDVKKTEESFSNTVNPLRVALENEDLDYIHLVNSPDLADIRPLTFNGWDSLVYYAYYLDLGDFEKNISKDARWTIDKATKNGVVIEKSEDIVFFWKLWTETFARQNLRPPASEDFFKNALVLLQNQNKGEMWTARNKSGEVAAAEILVHDDKRGYRWSAASHTELRKSGAPSLLLYEMLQDLKKIGLKEINLMAANTPHLAKFVAQFNPRLVPYYSVGRKSTLAKIAEHSARAIHLLHKT
jgi:hypothetical protein